MDLIPAAEPAAGPVPPGLQPGQVVTVFRSRLRADADGYPELAAELLATARSMPGFVDFKTFTADDDERVSVVTFASRETHDAWRSHPRHRAAQRRGRDEFYASYSIQVAECLRVSTFPGS